MLTRPLGASLGDTLTKPHEEGGFEFNCIIASLTILMPIAIAIVLTSRKAKQFPNPRQRA